MNQHCSTMRDSAAVIIVVGQDSKGHWLVQESAGDMEGHFVSFDAAVSYARSERHRHPGATIAISCAPLSPRIAL